eukprot:CAMPEP_0180158108 /NCGR_PEP_ID=MMETSP0986-20121125/26689_1 /TAXON_ID=697907 /ORGANISM="non described non described, Strain CCMP2293" /LENGTH=148 /DNA_ID=CAMNT_0022107853 /DNA_START=239 /DNA_END=683 /DNA_ORIENTATION=+
MGPVVLIRTGATVDVAWVPSDIFLKPSLMSLTGSDIPLEADLVGDGEGVPASDADGAMDGVGGGERRTTSLVDEDAGEPPRSSRTRLCSFAVSLHLGQPSLTSNRCSPRTTDGFQKSASSDGTTNPTLHVVHAAGGCHQTMAYMGGQR